MNKNESLIPDESAEMRERAAELLKAVAHPLRLGLVQAVQSNGRMTVSEICDALQAEQSLISHHLQQLREHRILHCDKEGRLRYYKVEAQQITDLLNFMEACGMMPQIENHKDTVNE